MRTAAGLVVAVGACMACAQEPVRLKGHVVDENNTPVPNAEVTIRYESRDLIAYSDPTGAFTFLLLKPGEYAIRVVCPGYFELRGRSVHLDTGANDVSLVLNRVREASESVNVSAVSQSLEMDKTTPEHRLDSRELLQIPYRDNNTFQNSLRTLPGVVQSPGGAIHINGGAEGQAYYALDGFNIADPLTGAFRSRLSVEAVQSMTVESGSVPAEYGKGSSGVVTVNTKMGDDRFRY